MEPRGNGAPPVILAERLAKKYGTNQALRGVSISVTPGEILGLIGPDGAGKSTLLLILAGILPPTAGRATVAGFRVDQEPEAVKACLGYMAQDLGLTLYGDLTVGENLDFFAELRRVPRPLWEPRKQELLALARLETARDRPADSLSGGMKQKLALCCTLIHEPRVLFLDEPTTGVDPVSRRDLWNLLGSLAASRGTTVVVATAYLEEADRCHRVALMYRGEILALDTPDAIRQLVPGRCVEVEAVPQAVGLEHCRALVGWHRARPVGERIRILLQEENAEQRLRADFQSAGIRLLTLEESQPTIEEAFTEMLRANGEGRPDEPAPVPASWPRSGDGPAVEVEGLTKRFGTVTAVDAVSFAVRQGEIFGLLGPNGSGKTTTMKMVCGIIAPTGGMGRIAGHDLTRARAAVKRRLGYMSQKFSLYRDLTVAENIALAAGIYGVPRPERAQRQAWVVRLADLDGQEGRRAADLPPGVRQRLALGCALVHRPEILFLDEPTSGVDPVARRRFWDALYRLSREAGVTILISTHYMDEAEQCERIALLYGGQVVGLGRPADLKPMVAELKGRLYEVQCDSPDRAAAILGPAFPGITRFGRSLRLFSRDPGALETIRSAIGGPTEAVGSLRIVERPISLEEVFAYFVEEGVRHDRAAHRHP